MPRLTRIYTKTGDDGTTGLGGGGRVPKDSPRVAAYGTVDELNSQLGVASASGLCERLAAVLPGIQNELFDVGSDLCWPSDDPRRARIPTVEARHIEALERLIDELNDVVGPLANFLLPGGSPGAAQLHVARTVCRRAERETVRLAESESIGQFVLPYLNRLSDALFVMARYENHERGVAEPLWRPGLLPQSPLDRDGTPPPAVVVAGRRWPTGGCQSTLTGRRHLMRPDQARSARFGGSRTRRDVETLPEATLRTLRVDWQAQRGRHIAVGTSRAVVFP